MKEENIAVAERAFSHSARVFLKDISEAFPEHLCLRIFFHIMGKVLFLQYCCFLVHSLRSSCSINEIAFYLIYMTRKLHLPVNSVNVSFPAWRTAQVFGQVFLSEEKTLMHLLVPLMILLPPLIVTEIPFDGIYLL